MANLKKTVHQLLRERFERLVADCRREGLLVVADTGDGGAIRLIPKEDIGDPFDCDLRGLGDTVRVDNGCGGGLISARDPWGSD